MLSLSCYVNASATREVHLVSPLLSGGNFRRIDLGRDEDFIASIIDSRQINCLSPSRRCRDRITDEIPPAQQDRDHRSFLIEVDSAYPDFVLPRDERNLVIRGSRTRNCPAASSSILDPVTLVFKRNGDSRRRNRRAKRWQNRYTPRQNLVAVRAASFVRAGRNVPIQAESFVDDSEQ